MARPGSSTTRTGGTPAAAGAQAVDVEPDEIGLVRTIPSRRSTASSIHKSEPRRFNEARDIADRYKDGVPVIMNLQSTDDTIARRLVDFASGLVYGLDGKIEMVANRVYLLTPANIEVSAEDLGDEAFLERARSPSRR